MEMMLSAMQRVTSHDSPSPELGFEILQLSAVAGAAYSVLNEQEPLQGLETSHRVLLESLEAIADVEDDVKQWISHSDVDALARGGDAAMEALDQFADASSTLSTDAPVLDSSSESASARASVINVSDTPSPTRATEPPTSGVTLANFDRIREGMSYEEVVSILGSSGELISSSDLVGTKTEMYQWQGTSLGANMNAMFQDGRLISKAQFGLE